MVEQNTVSLCGTCIHFRESTYPGHENFGRDLLAQLKQLTETIDPQDIDLYSYSDPTSRIQRLEERMERAGYDLGYLTCKPPSLLMGAYYPCQNPDLYTPKVSST